MQKKPKKPELPNLFREYKVQSISKLVDYEHNSRTHTDEQIQEVINSINEFGYTTPILVDEKHGIIAGHCRVIAAKQTGMEEIPTIICDGLTAVQKAALVIADNKLALNAGWNFTKLAEQFTFLKDNDYDTDLTGFKADELESFMPDEIPAFDGDEDEVPALEEEAVTKLGDVWKMGDHRLMCGDSTMIDSVDKLMANDKAELIFTDPPYGMSFQSGRGGKGSTPVGAKVKAHGAILNDDKRGDDLVTFIHDSIGNCKLVSKDGAAMYVCLTWRTYAEFKQAFNELELVVANCIVWDKKSIGIGNSNYRPQHEFIFYIKGEIWNGAKDKSDVWELGRDATTSYVHPTQKPVELIEIAITNSSNKKGIVLDVFGGSGSTLIACQKVKRRAYLMELSPNYCDVIVKRWEKVTGKKATLEG